MKKILIAALILPLSALAQTYPSPTFNSVTLQNPLTAANGGTGVANSSTITLGGNLTTSGANPLTITTTGSTNVTLPTSGTLLNGSSGATSGANSNITSLSGLTTPLSVPQGGTGVATSTGSGSVVLSASPSLTTPALGTPSAAVLTNATGLPISTGVSGLGTGVAAGLVNAATGSGSPVLGTSPTISGPTLTGITTTSNLQVNTGLSIGPTSASLNKDINVSQALTGTTSANCTTTTLIMYPCANLFYISADNADASSAPGPVMDGWQFAHNFGGSSMNGGRQIMDVIGHFTGPSNPANPLPGYVAIAGELITNSGDNGTSPDTTNGRGSFFAMNPVVVANSGAQNLFGIAGEEVNVQCNGCSTAIRYGVSVVNNGANQGSILANDAAFHVGSFNSGGTWHQALNLSSANGGIPLDSTGCVICTDTTGITIGTGIDLSHWTISGNLLAGPSGFVISGAGALTAPGGIGTSGGLNVSAGGASIVGGLAVAGVVSGTGFLSYLASPPAIGGGSPNAGAFTTLNASGNDAMMYTNGSSQSIPNNALTTVSTWTKVSDRVNANFNGSSGVYIAPATGYYQVSGQLTYSSGAGVVGAQYTAGIVVNGTVIAEGTMFQQSTSTTSVSVPFSAVVSLSSGQTLQIQAFQNSGAARTLNSSAAVNYLSINRLP